jgi:hypothetical protein
MVAAALGIGVAIGAAGVWAIICVLAFYYAVRTWK